jgi:hypothetical protein
MNETTATFTISDRALAAFTLHVFPHETRLVTVEPLTEESFYSWGVFCDGEPVPVSSRADAVFMRARDAMTFAIAYTGWDEVGAGIDNHAGR